MMRTTIAIVLAALVLAVSPARTAPQPSEIPTSWQLDLDLATPRAIDVVLPGRTTPQRFWFLRYTVTNRTEQDRIFVPDFILYTDTGQILRAGSRVPSAVFREIQKLYNDPLLKDMTGMTGKLLQGEDNAKDGVAIWTDFDPQAGAFDIFMGGLSGETVQVKLPTPIQVVEIDARGNEQTVEKDSVILSRTLRLQYGIAGEAAARAYVEPKLLQRDWVMR